jgi:hypothetical protein
VRAQLELHVYVALVLKTVLKVDDIGMLHRLVDLDLSKQLHEPVKISSEDAREEQQQPGPTLLLFLVDLSCSLAMTLTAFLLPSSSVARYTLANPPCEFNQHECRLSLQLRASTYLAQQLSPLQHTIDIPANHDGRRPPELCQLGFIGRRFRLCRGWWGRRRRRGPLAPDWRCSLAETESLGGDCRSEY